MISLDLYKIFVIVANQRNITDAAKILNISQPAVTKHIKNLENSLEMKLFERSKNGTILTKVGQELYDDIKDSINNIVNIDNRYHKFKYINLGSHATLLNKIFGKCLAKYYIENDNVKINTVNMQTDKMLNMLKAKELDILISKKIDYDLSSKIQYIKCGMLNDILVANKNSKYADKLITIDDIKNDIIFVPSGRSQTTKNFLIDNNIGEDRVKTITYNTMLEILGNCDNIGLVTKEYVEDQLDNYNLTILKTTFSIKPIEFGIYVNINRFRELNSLINIIKEFFKDN